LRGKEKKKWSYHTARKNSSGFNVVCQGKPEGEKFHLTGAKGSPAEKKKGGVKDHGKNVGGRERGGKKEQFSPTSFQGRKRESLLELLPVIGWGVNQRVREKTFSR